MRYFVTALEYLLYEGKLQNKGRSRIVSSQGPKLFMARVGGAAGGTLQIVVYVLTIFTTVCHLSPTLGHKKCSKKCHKANYRLPPPPSASFLSIPARWRTFYELSVAGQPGQIKYSPLGDFVRAKRLVMGAYFSVIPHLN